MKPPTASTTHRRSHHSEPPVPPSLLIERRRSAIHGHGVYARVAIPAFHVIIEYRGERITKAESVRREEVRAARARRGHDTCTYIFHLNRRHDLDGRHGGNLSRFINHSCRPNCWAELRRGRIWIVATEDILPGQELTFDYGFPFRDRADNPCRCGAPDCPGVIVAADQRWRLRRVVSPAPACPT
ncbi:MAG TPA: SET domain-containing protein-lysine N-methyltransferase [Opitutaceae bacterium]|nr:SET domain-containing protein-lysine N-methyltransferase [Opitutaceae bacterium]